MTLGRRDAKEHPMATIKFADISHLVDVAAFGGLHGIQYDLMSAAMMADYLRENADADLAFVVRDALPTALVIRYGRAFSGGVRDSTHTRDALATLSNEQLDVHNAIMAIRDKHFAHSVNAQEESWPAAQYYEERVREEGFTAVTVNHARTSGFGVDELKAIAEVARSLLAFVQTRITAEEARLLPDPASLDVDDVLSRQPAKRAWASDSRPLDKRRKTP
jgi:hypothetical protein